MARSSFGGSGDYSGLFAGLYAQAKALKAQQQDARDKDAYDRWKNGLMSDDDWLAYIESRVSATAGDKDPSDHQHWIGLQRQYIASIADSQAEFSYSEGKSTIGQLIEYYQGRLARMVEDSGEYRQVKGHLSDLVDKRDSEDLSTGAQAISDRIDRGQATYEDLLKFYKERLGGLRPGSELHKQVTSEIVKVRGTIADTKLAGEFERLKYLYQSGKLSGKSYAAKLTSMAAQFKESDPQRYYQILGAANSVSRAGRSGGGGRGGSWTKAERGLEDQFRGIDNYLELFSAAYKSGARVIPDPTNPGKQIVLTPELMSQIDEQRMSNFDKLAALYKSNGDNYKYTATLENKTKYVVNFVQPHNTIDASKQWNTIVGNTLKAIEAGADNTDPEATLKTIAQNFAYMQSWLRGQAGQSAVDQPAGDFLENSSNFVSQALALLGDTSMDSDARMAAIADLATSLDTDTGAHYDKGTVSAMKSLLTQAGAVSSAAYDLATGAKVMAITDKGIDLVGTRIQHTLDADADGMVNTDLVVPDIQAPQGGRVQEVWIDRGGVPTKVYAIAGPAPSPYQAWVATKNVMIGRRTYKAGTAIPASAIGQPGWGEAISGGSVSRQDAFAVGGLPLNFIQIPAYDDNGQRHAAVTWYQDPQTKLWYKGQPPISSASLNDDGTVKVGDDGKASVTWLPFAHVGGVTAPYVGSNQRAMQSLADQGAVGTDPRFNQPSGARDIAGNVTTDPSRVVAGGPQYFDPHDESNRASAYARIEDPAAAREKLQRQIDAAKKFVAADLEPIAHGAPGFQQEISRLATGLGIQGVTSTTPLPGAGEERRSNLVPPPSAAILEARRNRLAEAQAVPRVGLPAVKAGLDDSFAPPKMPTASGPALADLPATQATKLDIAKVTAAPKPLTTEQKAAQQRAGNILQTTTLASPTTLTRRTGEPV